MKNFLLFLCSLFLFSGCDDYYKELEFNVKLVVESDTPESVLFISGNDGKNQFEFFTTKPWQRETTIKLIQHQYAIPREGIVSLNVSCAEPLVLLKAYIYVDNKQVEFKEANNSITLSYMIDY